MITKDIRPARGSFDYLLTPLHEDAWRDTGHEPPPTPKRKAATVPTAPPPTPPERPGGSPRVRVEIEICQRVARPQARRGLSSLATLIWAVIAVILLMGLIGNGHAEQWRSYRDGFLTRSESDDGDRATSYRQGFERLTTIDHADGSTTRCRSWAQGWQHFTQCD